MNRLLFGIVALVLSASAQAQERSLDFLYQKGSTRGLGVSLQTAGKSGPMVVLDFAFAPRMEKAMSVRLGGIRPSGADVALKPFTGKFGGGYQGDGFSLGVSQLCPGAVVTSTAGGLDLFAGLGTKQQPLPKHLAWPAKGKVQVQAVTGPIDLAGLDAPWLLAWWGEASPFSLVLNIDYAHVSNKTRPIDVPVLILLQNRPKKLEPGKDCWSLSFDGPAGTMVMLPLHGQQVLPPVQTGNQGKSAFRPGQTEPEEAPGTIKWSGGLPQEVAAQATDWARRLRRLPTAVTEKFELVEGGVRITESFQYQDIDDAWKTPKQSWALVPPSFALSRRMKGPVTVEGEVRDLPWLGAFGPLTVADGKDSVAITIRLPQLPSYVGRPVWVRTPAWADELARSNPRYRELRRQLREEIGKVLAHNQHMAPYRHKGITTQGGPYWGNPADTVATLAWCLPFLETDQADKLKAYIRKEFADYDPLTISWCPYGEGIRREFYDWDPDGKLAKSAASKSLNLHNLYGVSVYIDMVAPEAGKTLWPRAKGYFMKEVSSAIYDWDGGETSQTKAGTFQEPPFNQRLNGYLGFVRLAKAAGDREAEALGTCLLLRGLAIQHAMAHLHQYLIEQGLAEGLVHFPPGYFIEDKGFEGFRLPAYGRAGFYFGTGFRGHDLPLRFFVDLTPEVGQFLHDHCRKPVTLDVKWLMYKCPSMWLAKGLAPFNSFQNENWLMEPWVPWATFLGLALGTQPDPDELCWYLGDSRARFGDLYHLQRLALALRAYASELP